MSVSGNCSRRNERSAVSAATQRALRRSHVSCAARDEERVDWCAGLAVAMDERAPAWSAAEQGVPPVEEETARGAKNWLIRVCSLLVDAATSTEGAALRAAASVLRASSSRRARW